MTPQELRKEAEDRYNRASKAIDLWLETSHEPWKTLAHRLNDEATALNMEAAAMEAQAELDFAEVWEEDMRQDGLEYQEELKEDRESTNQLRNQYGYGI